MIRLVVAAIVAAVILGMVVELNRKPELSETVEEYLPVKIPKKSKREPASVAKTENTAVKFVPQAPKITDRNPNSYGSETILPNESDKPMNAAGGDAGYSPGNYQANAPTSSGSRSRSPSSSSGSSNGKNVLGGSGSTTASGGAHTVSLPGVKTPTTTTSPADVPADSSSSTPSSGSSFSCSSNLGGGAYNHPLGVTLTCTSTAEIKYCLSQGTCCDPETAGTTYTSQIVVGAEEGQFCLSFVGEGSKGSSSVTNLNYDINHALPHLNVDHPRTTYQTTELAAMSFLTSNDFSKSGHNIGQLNLKSHDPTPSGLNLDCVEIMNDYSTFTSPLVTMTLALYDMLGILPSQQIEVPLNLNQLDYGDNFITTYVVNQSYMAPLYSCSTTKVVLNDFEFYQTDSVHREIGTGGVQEFTGGFQPYGVHSPDEAMRAPASVAGEADLEVGMVEIFY